LNDWLSDIEKLTTDNPIKLVIANKSDLEDKIVTDADIKEFTSRTGIEIIETSAKKKFQVEFAFEKMTKLLIERA
jgi:ribosome biogenesis GTPase A